MITQQILDVVAAVQPYLMIVGIAYVGVTFFKAATKLLRGESVAGSLGAFLVGGAMIGFPVMLPATVNFIAPLLGGQSAPRDAGT